MNMGSKFGRLVWSWQNFKFAKFNPRENVGHPQFAKYSTREIKVFYRIFIWKISPLGLISAVPLPLLKNVSAPGMFIREKAHMVYFYMKEGTGNILMQELNPQPSVWCADAQTTRSPAPTVTFWIFSVWFQVLSHFNGCCIKFAHKTHGVDAACQRDVLACIGTQELVTIDLIVESSHFLHLRTIRLFQDIQWADMCVLAS